ncbi:MAG: ActS/PrrB/RegB family redox-sensitive histidine kinase [Hyphomicrobiaceae bacterium]|nr:ActS/PrrB/RegB family redox-sensitive histidine kinase [Hyphomicrobiaceae bacterium]MCC0023891.1 ActS/PrrB/RegB family redox-sensitive histidine kinase [Hyphomicrobiaceae bacterium]
MAIIEPSELPHPERSVRLETLVRLRWLALFGQVATLLIVAFYLHFPVPLEEAFVLIAVSAGFNVALLVRFGAAYRPRTIFAAAQLVFDVLQLGGLLWLTGGLINPFAILLLAPVSVSATTLPQRETVGIGILTILIASVLAIFHVPLPWLPDTELLFPELYVVGLWLALVSGVVFIAAYTNRVAHESRQLSDALAATEIALSRQQQLSALDGLAAAAAHELGTPLSTITLAAKEIRREVTEEGALKDDLDLIIEQANRCRTILTRLRGLDDGADTPFTSVPVSELIAELARTHELPDVRFRTITAPAAGSEPVFRRNVGLLYGLSNFVENAAQFADSRVELTAAWTSDEVEIRILDDGPGFQPDLLAHLGEPYLTSRALNTDENNGPGGLGLGVFIAKTLLERTGASVSFGNDSLNGHALVRIVWPRDALSYPSGTVGPEVLPGATL